MECYIGADITLTDSTGRTPKQLAKLIGREQELFGKMENEK